MSIEPGCSSPSHTRYQPQSYKRISLEPDSDQVNHLYGSPEISGYECAFYRKLRFDSRHHL
jgi:hypothetical protein